MKMSFGQPQINTNTNILDIEVPEQMRNSVATGNMYIDALFAGDGILPSTVALVTGLPGAGKSTLMMQLADCLTQHGHIALYNGCEESFFQMRRVTNRLNLKNGFIVADNRDVNKVIEHANSLKEEFPEKKLFLFADSLQTLDISKEKGKRGRHLSKLNSQVAVTQALTEWAKETYNCVFIIGQVTKAGEFTGKQDIKHIVDCHMHMTYHRENRFSPETRCARMDKNRFGNAGTYYDFNLDARGISFYSVKVSDSLEDESEDENETSV